MIHGVVNANLEATIQVVVAGPAGNDIEVEAIIDTGYTGFLTLPPTTIRALALAWIGRLPGILADGSTEFFDMYEGLVRWDGNLRAIEVYAADADPLVGTALLSGHSLHVDFIKDGSVVIAQL
jgi:clan AA aspartic protease